MVGGAGWCSHCFEGVMFLNRKVIELDPAVRDQCTKLAYITDLLRGKVIARVSGPGIWAFPPRVSDLASKCKIRV